MSITRTAIKAILIFEKKSTKDKPRMLRDRLLIIKKTAAKPNTHDRQIPLTPHFTPIRKANGINTEAIATFTKLTSGRPIPSNIGANKTFKALKGIMIHNSCNGRITPCHLFPKTTYIASGATLNMPQQIGKMNKLAIRIDFKKWELTNLKSDCICEYAGNAT